MKYDCNGYTKECGQCPVLGSGSKKDLSNYIWKKKQNILASEIISFIAPSPWTLANLKKSSLFSDKKGWILPNTLDFTIFRPMVREELEMKLTYTKAKRIHILFGAVSATSLPYKGYFYLLEVLRTVKESYPELKKQVTLHIFGADESNEDILKEYECRFWGYIAEQEKMAALYNLADIYIVSSLEDSFNQTVLESMACETPVVSFATGGIVEIIGHKQNGYLAEYKNSNDIVQGICWVLENNKENQLGIAARRSAMEKFGTDKVAKQYINLYNELRVAKDE